MSKNTSTTIEPGSSDCVATVTLVITVPNASASEVVATKMLRSEAGMIRKLKSGSYRLYSRKQDPKTGRRRNLGTFQTRAAAEKHEHAVQYFKRAR